MAEILITEMDLSEDRQIIITKDGKVLATDWRGISMPTEATARELPPHGDLKDADVIGNWLREQHVFSMPTTCKIDSIIKDTPTVIEASTEGGVST